MSSTKSSADQGSKPSFSGANWSDYQKYRPVYPAPFMQRIYDYHGQKPEASWSTAHDVGAGNGIVSSHLAARFNHVVVSDPNEGYTVLARKLLIEQFEFPESKFTFLQERAEHNSAIQAGTVDAITGCVMMHFTDTEAAVGEFGRQLKSGGTLVMCLYGPPRIVGNAAADKVWKALWHEFARRATGDALERAFRHSNAAYDSIELPETEWESVKRLYINAHGSVGNWLLTDDDRVGESKVKDSEERIWIDDDEDWMYHQDFAWFKEFFATKYPPMPESAFEDLWVEMRQAVGEEKVKIEYPVALVLATKR